MLVGSNPEITTGFPIWLHRCDTLNFVRSDFLLERFMNGLDVDTFGNLENKFRHFSRCHGQDLDANGS